MPKRAFIIHGWKGTPEGAWRPWLKEELEKREFAVSVPAMPAPDTPKMKEWVAHIAKSIGSPDKDTYLVGHSLGCIAILRYLESLNRGVEIGGTVFVGGRTYSLGRAETETFFETPVNWKNVLSHCKNFVAIHSDNDSYVPLKEADIFREKLGAEIIIKHNMGHFTTEDKVFELPCVLHAVLEMAW